MNVIDQSAFQSFLQAELARRCDINARYSLRAFARYLSVDYSTLSKIMRGQLAVADRLVGRICEKLSVSPEPFLRLTPKRGSTPRTYASVDDTTLSAVSNWYCYALLELTWTEGFRPDISWIAKTLGISTHQVRHAKKQLLQLGLIEIDADGKWWDRSGSATTSYRPRISSPALRALQREILALSQAKLETIGIAHRDHSSLILRFATSDLDAAREALTAFRREFDRRFGTSEKADSVYCLSMNLIPLTTPKEKKNEAQNLH